MHLKQSSITLHSLQFRALHGVMPQENIVGDDYTVDLTVGYDATQASTTDEIAHAVNYATLYNIVKQEMAQPSKLLEHVAARIARHIAGSFPQATDISISITKHNPPMGADGGGATITLVYDR